MAVAVSVERLAEAEAELAAVPYRKRRRRTSPGRGPSRARLSGLATEGREKRAVGVDEAASPARACRRRPVFTARSSRPTSGEVALLAVCSGPRAPFALLSANQFAARSPCGRSGTPVVTAASALASVVEHCESDGCALSIAQNEVTVHVGAVRPTSHTPAARLQLLVRSTQCVPRKFVLQACLPRRDPEREVVVEATGRRGSEPSA
jgi:hypothetical protein